MRRLPVTCCLPALAIALAAAPALAETVIGDKRTTAIATSTAMDDVRISSAGSIVPTSGAGVIVDSANKATNEGTIQITNADDATGILARAGTAGGIVNSGKIIIDETYEPADADKDGDLDGPFASGVRRAGIRTEGSYAGNIASSGTITVEGNDSAGIRLGGPLTGNLAQDGAIVVTGDRAVGVDLKAVNGSVRIAGTVDAKGVGAIGARIGGDISGALVVQGGLGATGYRASSPPADASKLDADDLLQGGPALLVAGNVAGGIVLAVPPRDASTTDPDEDKDGIEDAKEGRAAVVSLGSAAAVQIGAADRAVTIGAVAGTGTGFGLIVDGTVQGAGTYAGVNGNGLIVGGQGGAVSIAGGIAINGSVAATSNGATATGVRIGAGASVPEIRVGGSVSASGTNATAIQIDQGGSTATIRVSGEVKATGGADGTAIAIVDRSGGVALVETSGAITAGGATATSDRNVAIDLSANGTGATVRQTAVASGVTAPAITGDIRFGSGNDLLDIADGSVKGTTSFGSGANRLTLAGDAAYTGTARFGSGADAIALAGTSVFAGAADFGGGADTLTLAGTSRFTGTLANAGALAVRVDGGTLEIGNRGSVAIGSLNVGAAGIVGVTIDKAGGSTLIDVAGNASFAKGAKLAVKVASILDAEGRYTVIRAGSLSGAGDLASADTALPFLFKSALVTSTPNTIAIDIARKTSTELGLNRSQASAYDAAYTALAGDAKVAGVFLGIAEGDTFRSTLRQMLPDHAGGTFEAVTQGSRATARLLADPNAPFRDEGGWGWYLQQVAWGTTKSVGDSAGYSINGWGFSGGGEIRTGVGGFGLGLAYLWGDDADRGTDNKVSSDQYELSAHWRGQFGPVSAFARGSAARIDFDGVRRFQGMNGGETIDRTIKAKWNGDLVSAQGGAAWQIGKGMFRLRPAATIDYYRLKEDGYAEAGGGKALDLTVDDRTSDELAVTGTVAAGLMFGGWDKDAGYVLVELEGGRRQIVGGALGVTTARFEGGEAFTLVPEARTDGWVGKLRATAGNGGFRVGAEVNAEEQQGRAAIALRASLAVGL